MFCIEWYQINKDNNRGLDYNNIKRVFDKITNYCFVLNGMKDVKIINRFGASQ